jgi:hypothetical protein
MAGNISEFISTFKNDPARSSRFEVTIPNILGKGIDGGAYLGLDSRYICEIAQLPGRNFSTMEQKTYGPVEKFPYWTNYNDIDMTFIVDDTMDTKVKFDTWMNYINPNTNFDFNYKNTYVANIVIDQYDIIGDVSQSITLIDAFPINMNQLDLDWSSDSFHKLTVTFAYTYWEYS